MGGFDQSRLLFGGILILFWGICSCRELASTLLGYVLVVQGPSGLEGRGLQRSLKPEIFAESGLVVVHKLRGDLTARRCQCAAIRTRATALPLPSTI